MRRLCEVSPVHIRDETERDILRAVIAQRLVRHHRSQVGDADANVDTIPDHVAQTVELTPEEGQTVASILDTPRRAIET